MNHAADLDLAQACLLGDEQSILALKSRYYDWLIGVLINHGSTPSEAGDIVGSLWGDCILGSPTRGPRLSKYAGRCALASWLKLIAVNEFIDQRRSSSRRERIIENVRSGSPDECSAATLTVSRDSPPAAEAPLFSIMQNALRSAFDQCASTDLVMLELVYIRGLTQREVAWMWGWTEAKVSRRLRQSMEEIEARTLRAVKESDAWLELKWSDFLQLCDAADFSLFEHSTTE